MATTDTILVGYDGSADSQRALDWAAEAARSRNAPLRVVVATGSLNQLPYDLRQQVRADVDHTRKEVESRLSAIDDVSTSVDVAEGAASHALLEAAKDAALVVLGARGHGALSGVLLGSVSQHVSRHASCPVVVVRQPYDDDATAVVVGVDGSDDGDKALAFAFDLAQRENRPLVAVHGWRSIATGPGLAAGYYGVPMDLESDAAEQLLRETLEQWRDKYPEVSVTSHAVAQPPAHVLADASQQAAIVVVGSRGRGAFTGLLLGSVGQAVLQRAQCPVVIAR